MLNPCLVAFITTAAVLLALRFLFPAKRRKDPQVYSLPTPAADGVESLRTWLQTAEGTLVAYHNHKETMAWTATALYVGGVGAFVAASQEIRTERPWLMVPAIVLVAIAVLAFTRMQFDVRSATSDALRDLREDLVTLVTAPVGTSLEFEPYPSERNFGYPRLKRPPTQETVQRGPKATLLSMSGVLTGQWSSLDRRWMTEGASYTLIVVATVVALVFACSSTHSGKSGATRFETSSPFGD